MKKKYYIGLILLLILFSGCVKKYEYKVIVYHRTENKDINTEDTITIKTTSYYPHFELRAGTCEFKIIEPNPLFPWTRRTRKIEVGYDQNGYSIISGLIKQP